MISTLKLATGFALGFAFAQPASAELLQFELTGSRQASFEIDSNTIPNRVTSNLISGDQIQYDNVLGTYGGVEGTATTISFGTGLTATLDIACTGLGFTQF